MFFEEIIKRYELEKFNFQKAKRKDIKEKLIFKINKIKDEIYKYVKIENNNDKIFEWRVEFAEIFSKKSEIS